MQRTTRPPTPPLNPPFRRNYEMNLTFSAALDAMKLGALMGRAKWTTPNGSVYTALQTPDANSKMRRPYFYKHRADGTMAPYSFTDEDLLATDWNTVG